MGSSDDVQHSVTLLRQGGLVAVPTETVYGLAGDAENEIAVRRIFATKGRPESHPLIVHISSVESLDAWAANVGDEARELAAHFWPGPLSLVFKKNERVSFAVTGGQDTVALRVPSHPLMQELLKAFGGGLAAPSANRFGRVSPTTAQHVKTELEESVDFILDGGPCAVGIESTILDMSTGEPSLLRPGGLPLEELEKFLGRRISQTPSTPVRAPGMLSSHYAPRTGVVLSDEASLEVRVKGQLAHGKKVAVLASSGVHAAHGARAFTLPFEPEGYARHLYSTLREIDELGFDIIVVVPPSGGGLGLAVRDRLRRAAAPRPS